MFFNVTWALLTAPPDLSMTVPLMYPVSCATEARGTRSRNANGIRQKRKDLRAHPQKNSNSMTIEPPSTAIGHH